MDSKAHFDCLQGGKNELPNTVPLIKFTAARMEEILSMKTALKSSHATKLAFQMLPKHMRRRAMSHNPKRVPTSIRQKHENQMSKSGLPPPQKKPSRKYRRRPKNLQEEYSRRQRKIAWLETHIWHAKRFHLINLWGYRLPEKPCDKAFRACYRASAKHCLLQDISYYNCVSIEGPFTTLLENLRNISDSSIGLTFAAKAFLNGRREGQTTLFSCNSENRKPIGNVYFLWNPIDEHEIQNFRIIWIWIHAAFYREALETIVNCFSLESLENSNIYVNKSSNIELKQLKYELSRFRLTGPLSTSVLQKALKSADLTINDTIEWKNNFYENRDNEMSEISTSENENKFSLEPLINNSKWYQQLLNDPKCKELLDVQNKFWKSLENILSVSVLSPHIVLSLIVSDPRYDLPQKCTKAVPNTSNLEENDFQIPQNVNYSPIWNKNIREYVLKSKISNKVISDLRSDLLVPGSSLNCSGAPVPIMLIQRPGCRHENIGYGGGWDIIIPSGWGQPFWIALIMRGARAGGLRESESLLFESRQQQFLLPDTAAGVEEEKRISELYKKKYFGLPPNKRINYHKMSIISPLTFAWENIIQCWKINSETVSDFHVIRSKRILQNLQDTLSNNKIMNYIDFNTNGLVPVQLEVVGKGSPQIFAIICLPLESDIIGNKAPTEPLKEDQNQQKRRELRNSHKLLLKRLSRKRKRSKQQGKIIPVDTEILANYTETMRKLWLPDSSQNIRFSCSREVIGMVNKGGFTFSQGRYCATGYIALGALPYLINKNGKVLVRNNSSLQYRFANISIIT